MTEPNSLSAIAMLNQLIGQFSGLVIVVLDKEGRYLSWHPGVEKQLGYSRQEFLGAHFALLLPPEDRAELLDIGALRTAGSLSSTRWLVNKAGRRVLVDGATIALRDPKGEVIGYGQIFQDVTEKQLAESSLSALARGLDQSAVVVRQWDGRIDHWTAGCHRLYGWSANEAVGTKLQDLLQTRFQTPHAEIQEQLRVSGTWQGELEHIRRDGLSVYAATSWVLLNSSNEEHLTVVETHTDITARLAMQSEVEAANRRLHTMAVELERSNEELEQFARIASHDLSAPITSTRWLVDLLISRHGDKLDESGRKILKQVSQGLDRMSDLVDAVLAHARVGTSAIGSHDPVSSETAVLIAMENLRSQIETSGAVIRFSKLPIIKTDKQALSQLFQNLFSNAIKYRRHDTPLTVRIAADWKEPHWEFVVEDNGIGIEPEWYERIFQPLQRRHGMEIAGSGIGLATCKKIVTRAGGAIWVRSVLGEGSAFHFTLPGFPPDQQPVR